MKIESVKPVAATAVSGQTDVVISITKEDADELRKALAVVQKYRDAAMEAMDNDPAESDWYMLEYAVKNDKVIVSIKDGMAG